MPCFEAVFAVEHWQQMEFFLIIRVPVSEIPTSEKVKSIPGNICNRRAISGSIFRKEEETIDEKDMDW